MPCSALRVLTSESALSTLRGIYERIWLDKKNHRPVHKYKENENRVFYEMQQYFFKYFNLCIPAPHWMGMGLLAERKVRRKATDLTVIPLIRWEHLSNGHWRDFKVVNADPNIQNTLNLAFVGSKKC